MQKENLRLFGVTYPFWFDIILHVLTKMENVSEYCEISIQNYSISPVIFTRVLLRKYPSNDDIVKWSR